MDPTVLLIVLVVAAGGGVVAYLSYQQQVRRREALALLCVEHGWSFAHAQDDLAAQLRGPFPLFRKIPWTLLRGTVGWAPEPYFEVESAVRSRPRTGW